MMFIDTSAMYAWTDAADPWHGAAKSILEVLVRRAELVVTHNYVVVEALTLVQRRLGMKAALALEGDVAAFRIDWVDTPLHEEAVARWKRSASRGTSLVDQVSFSLMRQLGVDTAFAFDRDFEREGFRLYRA